MIKDLKKEMELISKLDFAKDRYNTPVETNGQYAVVEKTIKEYFDYYALSLQEILEMPNNPQFSNILSYNNYLADGPDFVNSLTYLEELKKDYNEKIENLLLFSKKEAIEDFAFSKIKLVYFQNLSMEYLWNDSVREEYETIEVFLKKNQEKMNPLFDISKEVLEFLRDNSENWLLEDGEIRFQTDALYQQYNNYISKLKTNIN